MLFLLSSLSRAFWGRDAEGQLAIPTNAIFEQIAAGSDHSLGLTTDQRVLAWGFNNTGACNVPAFPQGKSVRQLATTLYGSIALLDDGSVVTWGGAPATQERVFQVCGGGWHVLGIKSTAEIAGVLPPSGPASGGTTIAIGGSGFGLTPTVRVGGVRVSNVTRISETRILAVTPPNLPGNVEVEVDGARAVAFYYRPECGSDLDQDGAVTTADISIVLLDFGPCYQTPLAAPTPDVPPLLDAQALPNAPRQR